jgi:carbon monoxide dehydrogenase subunit G
MELTGEVVIMAARERVWSALNDCATLQACIPGCEEVIDESPTVRRARLMVKVGPVRARFSGKLSLSEVLEPQSCLMGFEGSGGAAGMASGRAEVRLFEQDGQGGQTRLTYRVTASVGGKLGQIGGRLLDASARQLADQFFVALRELLAKENPAAQATIDRLVNAPVNQPVNQSAEHPRAADASAHDDEVAQQGGAPHPAALGTEPVRTGAGLAVAPQRQELPRANHSEGQTSNAQPNLESLRIRWFFMGVAATGFGVCLGAILF